MWDPDVCTNLMEGTPWIKHFAKHSQIGSGHEKPPKPLALGSAAWGSRSVARGGQAWGRDQSRVETGCLQTQGESEGARFPGGLPADSPPAGADSTKRQDLGGLGMVVGSVCLPTWVTARL